MEKTKNDPENPIMQRALGDAWNRLGDVVRRHYDVRPGTEETVVMDGTMAVHHSALAYPFLLMGSLFGALIAKRGTDVPVRVRNWCRPDSPAMHWHRTFLFKDSAPRIFASRMEYIKNDEIIEYVRFNVGVVMRLTEENGALVFTSRGYRWDLGPVRLHFPDWFFLGKAEIREEPIGGDRFQVKFKMHHPLFGETFGYRGEFCLNPEAKGI